MIQSLKQKLYQLRSDTTFFDDIYCDTVKHCEENNVAIPKENVKYLQRLIILQTINTLLTRKKN